MKVHLTRSTTEALMAQKPWLAKRGFTQQDWLTLLQLYDRGELEIVHDANITQKKRAKAYSHEELLHAWTLRQNDFKEDAEGHILYEPKTWRNDAIRLPKSKMTPAVFLLVTHDYITPEEAALMGDNKFLMLDVPNKLSAYAEGKRRRGPPIIHKHCPDHLMCVNPAHIQVNVHGRPHPLQDPNFRLGFPAEALEDYSVKPEIEPVLEKASKPGPKAAHTPIIRRLPEGYDNKYSLHLWLLAKSGRKGRPRRRVQGFELPLPDIFWLDDKHPAVQAPHPLEPYEVFQFDSQQKQFLLKMLYQWVHEARNGWEKSWTFQEKIKKGGLYVPKITTDMILKFQELEVLQEQSIRRRYGIATGFDTKSHISCAAIWDTGGDPLPPLE